MSLLHNAPEPVPNAVTSVYPSLLSVGLVTNFLIGPALESLVRCACRTLESEQSVGVYTPLPPNSGLEMLMTKAFGFTNISSIWPNEPNNTGWKVLGKKFDTPKKN